MPAHSWQPVDLVGLALEPPEPPTLDGIAYPGRRHIWSGEPESLKSWAALVLCAEEMHQGRDVVYVDLEMGRREMLARLRDLGLDDETIGQHFIYLEPSEPLSAANVRADLAALLADRLPTLAVVDAMTGALQLHGLDPNSGRDIETFYPAGVELLRTHGAAVIVLDHLTKDKESRGRFAIGSERKVGGADVHLGFETTLPLARGKSGKARIVTHKDRPGYLPRPKCAELELISDPDSGRISWTLCPVDQTDAHTPFWPTISWNA